ncbi:hypothetical protein JB92DRAFT_2836475 [Gautieria morchelliformis]|nr:hypothetical protein JB92DRAFT_2836475 [Gautieria morchelliformis]
MRPRETVQGYPAHGAPPRMHAVYPPPGTTGMHASSGERRCARGWGMSVCGVGWGWGWGAWGEQSAYRLMGPLCPTGASSKYTVVEVPGYNVTGRPRRMGSTSMVRALPVRQSQAPNRRERLNANQTE